MIKSPFMVCALVSTMIGTISIANAAEIKVLSDTPLEPALTRISDSFRRDSGHDVKFVFGLAPVIYKKIMDGESGDVVVIEPDFVDDLVKAGKVSAGQSPIIGRVGIGLYKRAGAHTEDTFTAENLKQLLLKADTIVFNNVASGNAFAKVLERLSMTEALKAKINRTSAADVVPQILQGKGNDIGVGPVPVIMADKRLTLIGALPSELQSSIVYTALALTNAQSREPADEFIHFLTLPETKKELAAAGVN